MPRPRVEIAILLLVAAIAPALLPNRTGLIIFLGSSILAYERFLLFLWQKRQKIKKS